MPQNKTEILLVEDGANDVELALATMGDLARKVFVARMARRHWTMPSHPKHMLSR